MKDPGNMDADTVRALRRCYTRDGAVFLPGVLDERTLQLAREAYEWSLEHPGPGASEIPPKSADEASGTFYQDLANPAAFGPYRTLVETTLVADLVASIWGKPDVWFMYEQVFLKTGGETRRTPWHQDLPYLPVAGDDLAVVWISFDPVPREEALEFVAGSHRGPVYDGSRFDPEDDTAPLYGTGELPRLPDIEADRDAWPIVSWPIDPGDVVIFHPAILHGGAPTRTGRRRRTLTLRFFGEDAVYARRPGADGALVEGIEEKKDVHPLAKMRGLEAGAPFRHPGFPKLRSA